MCKVTDELWNQYEKLWNIFIIVVSFPIFHQFYNISSSETLNEPVGPVTYLCRVQV